MNGLLKCLCAFFLLGPETNCASKSCCYLLYDESAVVDNVDERRRGFDPQVSGHKVLSVADPQHDPAKVDAQVTEQDLPVVEVSLGKLEDRSRGVTHAHQLAVGDRVVVVPEKT